MDCYKLFHYKQIHKKEIIMKNNLKGIKIYFGGLLAIILAFCIGCASIIAGGPQIIPIQSHPSDATLEITDINNGNTIFRGKTPYTATFERSSGYFKSAKYKIAITKEGYSDKEIMISGSPNGWYIGGNLLFGGLIGWLIVDPLTGAMWTLYPVDINTELSSGTSFFKQEKGQTIVLKDQLPELPDSVMGKMKPVIVGQ